MKFVYLKNKDGITITELIITMGISAILLIFIVSGSLFIKNYLNKQSQSNKVFEELSFVLGELDNAISSSREIKLLNDTLIVTHNSGEKIIYAWSDHLLLKGRHNLTSRDLKIDSLEIRKIELQNFSDSTILDQEYSLSKSGAYEVFIKISDNRKNSDSLKTIIVNNYEKNKYQ